MKNHERMSSIDTSWLRMDRPHNLMMIVGIMMFDGPLDFDRLKSVLATRLCAYRRFRQRVEIDATGATWIDDPDFDIDAHVRRAALPRPGGKAGLEKLAARLVSTPLDPRRPLWQYLVVENYDGGWAIIVRIHHCIADGIALMSVLMSMTDDSAAGHPAGEIPADEPDEQEPEAEHDPLSQILAPVSHAVADTVKISGALWQRSLALVSNPTKAADYARIAGAIAGEIGELALMGDDSPTRFKGQPGVNKKVAWSEPIPLDEVKAACKALGCSVNDMLLSCVAGSLREYLIEKGDSADGVELRALVPVNLRPPGDEMELGNRFGLVALVLPLGMAHPITRLFEVRHRMEARKGGYQAMVTLGLLAVVGILPKSVQEQVLDMLAAKATAVMTNVPGPQKPLYLAGSRLRQQMCWVPQSGNIGMGVSILSYDGKVQFGLVTDRGLVPDPANIVARFRPEFEKILYRLLLEPWEGERPLDEIRERLKQPPVEKVAATPKRKAARKPRAARRKPATSSRRARA